MNTPIQFLAPRDLAKLLVTILKIAEKAHHNNPDPVDIKLQHAGLDQAEIIKLRNAIEDAL